MKRLVSVVPKLTIIPHTFRGEHLKEALGKINDLIDSKFKGNTKLKVLTIKEINGTPTIIGSNSLISPVVNQVIGQEGYRTIQPEELETTLQEGDPVGVSGNFYVDTGIVLDFSGQNHELARHLFEQLPEGELRDLDRLPAIMIGYGLANSDIGSYGVALTYQDGTELRTAKILDQSSGNFEANDPELVKSGLPSLLDGGKRRLYNSSQGGPSVDNLGLSRLLLGRGLNLNSDGGDLASSNGIGRVVSVAAGTR